MPPTAGAGLYESIPNVDSGDAAAVQGAVAGVWASLFSRRAVLSRHAAGALAWGCLAGWPARCRLLPAACWKLGRHSTLTFAALLPPPPARLLACPAGVPQEAACMAVVVQQQLAPDLCFVLHTRHPGAHCRQGCAWQHHCPPCALLSPLLLCLLCPRSPLLPQ